MKFGLSQRVIIVILFVLVLTGCKQIRKVSDIITKPSARELYAREFEQDTTLLHSWQSEFRIAETDSLHVTLPYVEVGKYFANRNVVYSYQANLQAGSILHIKTVTNVFGRRIFLDVLQRKPDSTYSHLKSNAMGENELAMRIEESGAYRVVIQPEIYAEGKFAHQLYTTPSFGFPVAGKSHKAILSYWGAERDGGSRSHQGVDIFAERGTPVIAVIEGSVSAAGNRGLGGKQVWLRTGFFGKSLYYAHLDSIIVKTGSKVKLGDTLGFVGNTGNARTTSPHLHFGIYESGKGAIDPLPFIKQTELPNYQFMEDVPVIIKISSAIANLRDAPNDKGYKIGEAVKNDTLLLLGYTDKWAHIKSKKGLKAFVHRSLISVP